LNYSFVGAVSQTYGATVCWWHNESSLVSSSGKVAPIQYDMELGKAVENPVIEHRGWRDGDPGCALPEVVQYSNTPWGHSGDYFGICVVPLSLQWDPAALTVDVSSDGMRTNDEFEEHCVGRLRLTRLPDADGDGIPDHADANPQSVDLF
jgi:hypothetical protein